MKRLLCVLAVLLAAVWGVLRPASAELVLMGPFERPNAINLTDEGTFDWVHYGNTGGAGTSDFNHKDGAPAPSLISDISMINGGYIAGSDYASDISWTDGTPDASATDVHTFVFSTAPGGAAPRVGDGFSFTAAADAELQQLNVYLGTWNSTGTFTATLGGGEPETMTVALPSAGAAAHLDGFYSVLFSGAGETLTVDWTVAEQFHAWGNVQLVGATLTGPTILTWDGSDPADWGEVLGGDSHWEGSAMDAIPDANTSARIPAGTAEVTNTHAASYSAKDLLVGADAVGYGTLAIDSTGQLDVAGDLTVSGDAGAGAAALAVDGSLAVGGAFDVGGSLSVGGTGAVTAGSMTASGPVDLDLAGGASVSIPQIEVAAGGSMTVNDHFSQPNLTLSGGALVNQGNNLTVTANLSVSGGSSLDTDPGTLMIDGADVTVGNAGALAVTGTMAPATLIVSGTGVLSTTGTTVVDSSTSFIAGPDSTISIGSGSLTVPTAAPPEGVAAYYSFDNVDGATVFNEGTLADKDGTLIAGASLTTGAEGIVGEAMALTAGSPGRLLVDTGGVDLGEDWTIGAWFYNAYPNSNWRQLARGDDGRDGQIGMNNGSNELGGFDDAGGLGFVGSGYDLPHEAVWHHVAAVGSGTTTDYYVDGGYVGTADFKSTTEVLWIGGAVWGHPWSEKVDEFYIYDTALSAEDVADLAVTSAGGGSAAFGNLEMAAGTELFLNAGGGGTGSFRSVTAGAGATIRGSATVRDILAPGSSIGTLGVTGDFVMAASGTYAWETDGVDADLMAVGGDLVLEDNWTLLLQDIGGTPVAGEAYSLFTYGTIAGGSGSGVITNAVINDSQVAWPEAVVRFGPQAGGGDDHVYLSLIGTLRAGASITGVFIGERRGSSIWEVVHRKRSACWL